MKGIFTSCLNSVGLAYWVQIDTQAPTCTYYFGPFSSQGKAEAAAPGYVEDLEGENAQNIRMIVKRFKPTQLTIVDKADEMGLPSSVRMVSGRV